METLMENEEEHGRREVKLPSLIPIVPEPELERETGERRQGRDILIAVDHGPNSKHAFDWALIHLCRLADTLHLVHVVSSVKNKLVYETSQGLMEKLAVEAIQVAMYGTKLHKSSLRAEKFKDIFESLSAICDQKVLKLFIKTARSIWHRRNKLIFEGYFQHPTQIASQSKILLEELKAVHDSPRTNITGSQVMNWNPPPPGFLKINWDAAISEVKGRIGLGIVVRDHGEVLGAFQAVMMAADSGMGYVFFEGDSSQVVKGLNSHVERWDRVGMVLSDTRMQLITFSSWKFLFVKRSANHLAHSLAKYFLQFDEDTVVLDLSPGFSHVRTVARIMEGDPGKVICKEAERLKPAAVVMGTRGRSIIQSVLQGSVSEYCFHNCKSAPVVIVPVREAGDESLI